MNDYIQVNMNQGNDDSIYNTKNIKESKQVFFWAEKQLEAGSAFMRNMFEASVEENLLSLFAEGIHNYYYDEDKLCLSWTIYPNIVSLVQINIDIYRKDYVGLYEIIFSNMYKNKRIVDTYSYFTFAEVDDICHIIMKQISEYIGEIKWN